MSTRSAELAQIEQFLSANGATKIPSRYLAPTSTDFSPAEEARRLSGVHVRKMSRQELSAEMHRLHLSLKLGARS
jgi:hypothetical protein